MRMMNDEVSASRIYCTVPFIIFTSFWLMYRPRPSFELSLLSSNISWIKCAGIPGTGWMILNSRWRMWIPFPIRSFLGVARKTTDDSLQVKRSVLVKNSESTCCSLMLSPYKCRDDTSAGDSQMIFTWRSRLKIVVWFITTSRTSPRLNSLQLVSM